MSDDNVSVKFGADTAGVTTGGGEVKGILAGIMDAVKALGAGFKEMGAAAVEGFAEAKEGAVEAAETIKGAAEAVTALREAISGIGEAILVAFAVDQIKEFAKGLAETAEQVQHTATTFGLATGEVQQLKAEAALLGVPFESLLTAMQRSDRALTTAREGSKQAGEAFKALGINIHEPISQVDLIQKELAGLANVQDTPTRIGLAMQLFGRNIQQIAPMIGVTKEQLDEFGATIGEFGAVSDDAQRKGLALAESFNQNTVAMQGLGNVMTSALAPVLTEIVDGLNQMIAGFIKSYNEGGEARQVLDGLAVIMRVLSGALEIATKQFADEAAAIGAVSRAAELLTEWVGQVADQTRGFNTQIEQAVPLLGNFDRWLESVAGNLSGPFLKGVMAVINPLGTLIDLLKQLGVLLPAAANAGGAVGLGAGKPGTFGSAGGGVPNLGGGKKGGKGTDPTQAAIQADTDQWQHFADWVVVITGKANTDMLQAEIDFWSKKLNAAKQGSDLWFAVLEKLNPLVAQQEAEHTREVQKAAAERIKAVNQETDAVINSVLRRYNEELEVERFVNSVLVKDGEKSAEQYKRAWDRSVGSIAQDFGRGLIQMAEGATSFGQLMGNIGNRILEGWVDSIAKMVSDWARGMATHVALNNTTNAAILASNQAGANANLILTLETNLKKIASDAKTAAAGAYNWAAAWGGPIAGAAAAAIAFAGVMALGAIGSAEGGWWGVPADNMLTNLHKDEHVIPANIARPMSQFFEGGGAGSAGGGGSGVGGPWGGASPGHTFNITGSAQDAQPIADAVRKVLRDEPTLAANAVSAAARSGWRSPHSTPFKA